MANTQVATQRTRARANNGHIDVILLVFLIMNYKEIKEVFIEEESWVYLGVGGMARPGIRQMKISLRN